MTGWQHWCWRRASRLDDLGAKIEARVQVWGTPRSLPFQRAPCSTSSKRVVILPALILGVPPRLPETDSQGRQIDWDGSLIPPAFLEITRQTCPGQWASGNQLPPTPW